MKSVSSVVKRFLRRTHLTADYASRQMNGRKTSSWSGYGCVLACRAEALRGGRRLFVAADSPD